jgi:hypothetical protein
MNDWLACRELSVACDLKREVDALTRPNGFYKGRLNQAEGPKLVPVPLYLLPDRTTPARPLSTLADPADTGRYWSKRNVHTILGRRDT